MLVLAMEFSRGASRHDAEEGAASREQASGLDR